MINHGNHKSAKAESNVEALLKSYNKEVSKGWMIPIYITSLNRLILARVIPIGVVTQWTINSKGDRKNKQRVTHDCSFSPPSGHSINTNTDIEKLDECIY